MFEEKYKYTDRLISYFATKEEVSEKIKHLPIKNLGLGPIMMLMYQLPSYLKDDKDIMFAIFKKGEAEGVKTGSCIQYASSSLKNDKEVALIALKYGASLNHLGYKLIADREVVMVAVKMNGANLQYTIPELRDDYDVVMTAVKNGNDIKWASERLRDNETIALEAVKRNGYQLEFISPRLKRNKKIVIEALKQKHEAFEYVVEELRTDPEILRIVMHDKIIWANNAVLGKNGFRITPEVIKARSRLLLQEKDDSREPIPVKPIKEVRREVGDDDPPVFPENRIILPKKQKDLEDLSKKELLEMIRMIMKNQENIERRLIDIQRRLGDSKESTISRG